MKHQLSVASRPTLCVKRHCISQISADYINGFSFCISLVIVANNSVLNWKCVGRYFVCRYILSIEFLETSLVDHFIMGVAIN